MKRFFIIPAVIALAALASCQKQQTEADKNAEVERQVQERLAAEHQTERQQQMSQREADLDAREKALAEKKNAAAATPNSEQRVESESIESRSRVRESRESAPTGGYSMFYTKLEPYGAWLETSDYGYVWQPRQAESSRSWRPYTTGRWVYTDAGWTWISEEPFGWATYHYGRWTRLRGVGWVWVPGNDWAPAWVSWRKSNDYVGWAPLPPEARFDQRTGIHNWSDSYYDIGPDQYSFVATREFGAQRVESVLLPPERNVTIVDQTTNVTNITYNNTTIVNEGPSYDEVRAQSREPVQRLQLERNVNVVAGEPQGPEVRGETVVIAAPVIAAPVASERPPNVKQTIAAVTVDLGWEAIADHEAAKKAREKMKSEATPPPNAPPKKFVKVAATTSATTQANEASATSTSAPSATVAPSAATTLTPVASAVSTATPQPKMTPRNAATVAPTSTPFARATPASSAAISPTASQRRGRLLVPSATPSPRIAPSATPRPAAQRSPTPSDTIPSTQITPPSASQTATNAASQQQAPQGKFKSQAQRFNPRKIEPMPSASPSATVGSTSSPNAASTSPAEKLTKQENKEQQREEKKELKRERREGSESASPSATP